MQLAIATIRCHRAIVTNAAFTMATTFLGSMLGFVFWLVAARLYSAAQIGMAAACVSAVTLLASLGDLGLGTAIVRFLPTMGARQVSFINTSLLAVAASSVVLVALFVSGIPLWSPEMRGVTARALDLGVFAGTSIAFALVQFLDRVYVALQVTPFMFVRNLVANLLRLLVLIVVGRDLGAGGVLVAIGLGATITLVVSLAIFVPRKVSGYHVRLDFSWAILKDNIGYSLGNHLSLLLWNGPPLIYPLVILDTLGAAANASFYTSWMIANLLFVIPVAVATSAFAQASSRAGMTLRAYWRTMWLMLAVLAPVASAAAIACRSLLSMFGDNYAAGGPLFLLLVTSAFPYTLNTFVITQFRLRQDTRSVVWLSGLIAITALVLVVSFAKSLGLIGVGWGWLAAQMLGIPYALLVAGMSEGLRPDRDRVV